MKRLVNVKQNPNIAILSKIENYFDPTNITLYTKDNTYKINDYIYKNTEIDDSFASISGFISNIKKESDLYKLTITNDYKENSLRKGRKYKVNNKKELLDLFKKENNLKLYEIFNLDKINNLVITAIDEEVYAASEAIYLENYSRLILDTIDKLLKILKLDYATLFVKSTSYKGIKKSNSIIGSYPNIKIVLAPDRYLIGRKNFLCEYLNLTYNTTVVLKTEEIIEISHLLENKKMVEKIVTICDDRENKGLVINTRIGVSIKDLIDKYFNLNTDDDIYINGLLGGYKLINDQYIDKDIFSIIITSKSNDEETECINCGACNRICPFNIKVKLFYERGLYSKKCINCGLCNYICPARIDLKKVVGGKDEK